MYKKILFPVDLSQDSSVAALASVSEIARRFDGDLTLLNVQVPVPSMVTAYLPDEFTQEATKDVAIKLKAAADEFHLGATTDVAVRHGTAHHEILRFAEEGGFDLIVIASHQPVLSDYLLGSTATQVVRHAKCSVIIVRG